MTFQRTASVKTGSATSYQIRSAQGEYAIVYIDHGKDANRPGIWWGSITSHGSFGNFGTYWGSCGCPFPQFLARIDFDYAMKNLREYKHRVFDLDATVLDIKRFIIKDRRTGCLEKDEAKGAWDALYNARHYEPDSWVLFAHLLMDSGDEYFRDHPSNWDFGEVTRPDSDCVGFWEQIWPILIVELNKETA